MKNLAATAALFFSFPAFAMSGGASSGMSAIPCTATPPSQASSFGIVNIKFCDTFQDLTSIDVNNSGASGYDWYPAPPLNAYVITPPKNITTDGTGMELLGGGGTYGDNSSGKTLQTVGRKTTSPYYVGVPISGSYYAEVEFKFDSTTPGNQTSGNAPAWWDNDYIHYLRGNSYPVSFPTSYVELDMVECLPGSPGAACGMNTQFHHWVWNDTTKSGSTDCSSNNMWTISPTVSNYNKYGVMVVTSADNGGTGLIRFYLNNNQYAQCTYTAGGTPNCTNGQQSCPTGALMELDTQQTTIMFGDGYYPWQESARNFHVWTKN